MQFCIYYRRYRQAWTWEDKTVDYCTHLSFGFIQHVKRPACGFLNSRFSKIQFTPCGYVDNHFRKYLCQMPDRRLDQRTQPMSLTNLQARPSLVKVNVTVTGQKGEKWWPVICPDGPVTHMFLACDVTTFCWADGEITFNSYPDSWAVPTSKSCPVQSVTTSLPPSFRCQSEKQHVPYSLVCDHRRDCLDGSDEIFCVFVSCQQHSQFQCLNKQVCHTNNFAVPARACVLAMATALYYSKGLRGTCILCTKRNAYFYVFDFM